MTNMSVSEIKEYL